jgi:hypothetical protein
VARSEIRPHLARHPRDLRGVTPDMEDEVSRRLDLGWIQGCGAAVRTCSMSSATSGSCRTEASWSYAHPGFIKYSGGLAGRRDAEAGRQSGMGPPFPAIDSATWLWEKADGSLSDRCG